MLIHAFKDTLRVWWHNLVHLTILNFLWLICQLLIIPAPAATAAMYGLVERIREGDLVTLRDAWETLRAVFVPAWKWAACNLVVLAVLGGYLWWLSSSEPGIVSATLGFVALFALAFWLAMNSFYWSLWLAQDDASVRNTFRNAAVLVLANPGAALLVLLFSGVVVAVSALTLLPLIHLLMVWLALFSRFVTKDLIQRMQSEI